MNSRMDKFYNIMTRTIMFISSYFPLYIMIIILYFSKITKGFLEKNILIIGFATLTLILIFISVISVTLLKLGKGTREKGINNLENPDDTVLSYIMTYIIPLITNGDNSKEVYIVNILKYIKLNIFPIIAEVLFVLVCLLFQGYYIYINFLFYIVLAIYFWLRKDFSVKGWIDSVKGGSAFWKQVMLTILFFCLAFLFTNILENMFPHLSTGMINLKADNWLKLILFAASTIILPPIAEEVFYRKNLTSFKNRKILILTTLFSMFAYGLEHTFTIWGIFLCMIWALPLSVSYIKTKNIYVTMTAHFICNFVVNGIAVVKICDYLLH